jgi:D-serine deaminase-like pyridoxal phosphate-dependent protein
MFQAMVEAKGLPVPRRVMGGTISFPYYARFADLELSPGTCVLHDWGYLRRFPDLPFVPAAVLLSRIISIQSSTRVTLDLGSKAIAADPSGARGLVWSMENVELIFQNEEHWVVELPDASSLQPGQPVYVLPTHICPTCALHRYLYVIGRDGRCVDRWAVTARDRE